MAYKHGVYVNEIPTALVAPRTVDSAIPFVVGTAPIHLSGNGLEDTSKQVHYPILANNYEEYVTKLGYSDNWKDYTLCEFAYAAFQIYNYAPIVFVNVLDPEVHKRKVNAKEYTVEDGQVTLGENVILDSVVVSVPPTDEGEEDERDDEEPALPGGPDENGDQTLDGQEDNEDHEEHGEEGAAQPALAAAAAGPTAGVDFTLGWTRNAQAVLNIVEGGMLDGEETLLVEFDVIDPSLVTKADVIGGYNAISKRSEGLELIDKVFPKFGKIALHIAAPGWSDVPEVAAVMTAKCEGISGLFPAIALTDIPTKKAGGVTDYTEVNEWKRLNSYTDKHQRVCWPLGKLGDRVFHLSTIDAAMMALTDLEYRGIPYASPSNHLTKMTGAVLEDGTEILLDLNGANLLNENGITTLFNWESGWMLWGNEMACYPSNTDPKDRFVNIRRFYNWYACSLILTWFQKVDAPLNRRLLETIADTENIRLNSYVNQGALVGSNNKLEFRADDNPTTSLIDGIITAHIFLTVPPPARDIEFLLEYDPDNLLELFM